MRSPLRLQGLNNKLYTCIFQKETLCGNLPKVTTRVLLSGLSLTGDCNYVSIKNLRIL